MPKLCGRSIACLLTLLLILGFLIVGCAPEAEEPEEPAEATDPEEPEEEEEEERKVLYIGEGEITAVDPHKQRDMRTGRTLAHAFENLVRWSRDGELVGCLAESWEVNEDGSRHTFYLQENVTFHDGTPFNAEAAKFSLERVLDPETASPSAGMLGDVGEINVVDEYTVEVVLDTPNFLFPEEITGAATGMVSPTAVEELGEEFGDQPVGTGPFKIVRHDPGSRLVMEAFADYWDGAPHIDEVVIRIIPEEDSQEIELEAGNLHIANYLTSDGAVRLSERDEYSLVGRAGTNQRMVAFNVQYAPMDDLRLRQAISYSIDREATLEEVFMGMGIPATTGILPGHWSHNDDVTPVRYDIDRAEELLDEAGWVLTGEGVRERDGEKLDLIIFTGSERERVRASEVVQAFISEVAISSSIESFEWGTYLDYMREEDYHLSFWTMNYASPDPNSHMQQFHSEYHWNIFNYADSHMDELLTRGRMTTDQQERKAIYDEIQEIVLDDAICAWLFHFQHPLVARAGVVQDLYPLPSGFGYLLHEARLVE